MGAILIFFLIPCKRDNLKLLDIPKFLCEVTLEYGDGLIIFPPEIKMAATWRLNVFYLLFFC